jgi:RNA polymerase sigma factor (sigma-70 family)
MAVSADELRDFDDLAQAQRLRQLEADRALMRRLSVEGYEGQAWEEVANALVDYGFAVMRAWTVTGQVFGRCRAKGFGGPSFTPPAKGIPRQDALELATDTVATALINFRDSVLKRGVWDPNKGASLTSFFVGNCLLRFPNEYRKWRRDWSRRLAQRQVDMGMDPRDDRHPAVQLRARDDPADETVRADSSPREIERILAPITDQTNRAILQLTAEGFSLEEIAEVLGLSYKQAEARLYRVRQKLGRKRKGAA